MVTYARIGASRMYVPTASAAQVAAARIAFIRDDDQADPGPEIDVISFLHRGAVVVYPTVTEGVAQSLVENVPRMLDEARIPGQRIRLAFLTATGEPRIAEALSTDGSNGVARSTEIYVGDPSESKDSSWYLRIPAHASIGARDGALVIDLGGSGSNQGGGILAAGDRGGVSLSVLSGRSSISRCRLRR